MTASEFPAGTAIGRGAAVPAGFPVQRKPAPFDVVAVAAGVVLDGRHLESVRLTVIAVSLDGCEVDCTEYTGGPPIHLCASEFRVVSPPRGAWS